MKGFWLKHLGFTEAPPPRTVQTSDPREALLIASGMSKLPYSAFFLKAWGGGEDELPEGEEFRLELRPGLAQPWLSDYTRNKDDPFVLDTRYVRIFDHWVSNNVSEKQAVRQERRMVEHLYDETSTRWSKVVFVPRAYFVSGRQFSESVYEYLAAMVLRMMGFYVVRDYQPRNSAKMPDLSAFRTDDIKEMIDLLRRKRLLKYGATSAELQMIRPIGRVEPLPLLKSPDFETVVVEVKKSATRYSGISQLFDYYYEAGELYDTGYTCAPFLDEDSAHEYWGSLSLTEGGDIVEISPSKRPERYSSPERQQQRKEELDHVAASFKLELLKNVGLEESLALVSKGDELTYSEFMKRLINVDPETIIELVESKMAP